MSEVEPGQAAAVPASERVGDRLRSGREARDLTLAEVAQRTRVPLRHLTSIEKGDYGALPSPTYAVGFARAYARSVGLDEVAVAQGVRGELRHVERPPEYAPYEAADPARVPSRGVAAVGLGLAVAILVLVGLWYGTDLFRGGRGGQPVATAEVPAATPATVTPVAPPTPAAPRQVTLTAGGNEVWMRVYDADNQTLYLGTLAPGASFDVPPAANRPMINVGRPDELIVKVDGRAVPPLGDGRRAIKDVPVDAASIAARLSDAAAAGAGAAGAGTGAVAARTDASRPSASPERAVSDRGASAPPRADIDADGNPPATDTAPDQP